MAHAASNSCFDACPSDSSSETSVWDGDFAKILNFCNCNFGATCPYICGGGGNGGSGAFSPRSRANLDSTQAHSATTVGRSSSLRDSRRRRPHIAPSLLEKPATDAPVQFLRLPKNDRYLQSWLARQGAVLGRWCPHFQHPSARGPGCQNRHLSVLGIH